MSFKRIKKKGHVFQLSDKLNTMFKDKSCIDATLICDGQSINVHKVLLSSLSPYFKELFMNNPSKHSHVYLQNVSLLHLKSIIHYIYHGKVNVEEGDLDSFLTTAEYLKIQGLTKTAKEDCEMNGSHISSGSIRKDRSLHSNDSFRMIENESPVENRLVHGSHHSRRDSAAVHQSHSHLFTHGDKNRGNPSSNGRPSQGSSSTRPPIRIPQNHLPTPESIVPGTSFNRSSHVQVSARERQTFQSITHKQPQSANSFAIASGRNTRPVAGSIHGLSDNQVYSKQQQNYRHIRQNLNQGHSVNSFISVQGGPMTSDISSRNLNRDQPIAAITPKIAKRDQYVVRPPQKPSQANPVNYNIGEQSQFSTKAEIFSKDTRNLANKEAIKSVDISSSIKQEPVTEPAQEESKHSVASKITHSPKVSETSKIGKDEHAPFSEELTTNDQGKLSSVFRSSQESSYTKEPAKERQNYQSIPTKLRQSEHVNLSTDLRRDSGSVDPRSSNCASVNQIFQKKQLNCPSAPQNFNQHDNSAKEADPRYSNSTKINSQNTKQVQPIVTQPQKPAQSQQTDFSANIRPETDRKESKSDVSDMILQSSTPSNEIPKMVKQTPQQYFKDRTNYPGNSRPIAENSQLQFDTVGSAKNQKNHQSKSQDGHSANITNEGGLNTVTRLSQTSISPIFPSKNVEMEQPMELSQKRHSHAYSENSSNYYSDSSSESYSNASYDSMSEESFLLSKFRKMKNKPFELRDLSISIGSSENSQGRSTSGVASKNSSISKALEVDKEFNMDSEKSKQILSDQ